jgi:hypothetical protein
MVFDEFVQDKDEGSKLSDLVPPPWFVSPYLNKN